MVQDLRLAQLISARLCHELGGPVGTVEGSLGFLGAGLGAAGEAEALSVAREGAEALRRRLRLYRAAWGAGVADMGVPEMLDLVDGVVAGGRARVEVAFAGEPVLPAALAHLLLNAVLLAGEALPRGGTVRLAGDPAAEVAVLPEGPGAAWPRGLATALAAGGLDPDDPAPSARAVQAPFLVALAAASGARLSLTLGGLEPAPLLIAAPPSPAAGAAG
jgi:histidine phosphotransferase ChpT